MTPVPRPTESPVRPPRPERNPARVALAAVMVLSGLLACSIAPAHAAQVIRFKTGFEIAAKAVRYEGTTVYLTLESGNEVGFPTWTIDEVISDDEVRFAPEGPSLSKVGGRFVMGAPGGAYVPGGVPKGAREFMILNSASVHKSKDGKSTPVGYSFGNEDEKLRSTPSGPVSAAGKVGKGIREEAAKTRPGFAPNGQATGGGVKIVKPVTGQSQSTQ